MPDPSDYEDEDSWMSACVPDVMDEGKDHEQAVGKCLGMWNHAEESANWPPEVKGRAVRMVVERVENGQDPDRAIDEVRELINANR